MESHSDFVKAIYQWRKSFGIHTDFKAEKERTPTKTAASDIWFGGSRLVEFFQMELLRQIFRQPEGRHIWLTKRSEVMLFDRDRFERSFGNLENSSQACFEIGISLGYHHDQSKGFFAFGPAEVDPELTSVIDFAFSLHAVLWRELVLRGRCSRSVPATNTDEIKYWIMLENVIPVTDGITFSITDTVDGNGFRLAMVSLNAVEWAACSI